MTRPRVLAVLALVTGFALVVVVLWSSSPSSDGGASRERSTALTLRAPLAEALRYVPRSAGLVAVVQTDTARGPLASALATAQGLPGVDDLVLRLQTLVGERTGLSLADDVSALAGAPAVLARVGPGRRARTLAAWTVPDATALGDLLAARVRSGALTDGAAYRRWATYRGPGGVLAARDRVVLGASDVQTLRAAIARRTATGRAAGLTPAGFTSEARSGMDAAQAVVRVAADGPTVRSLLATRLRGASALPWVAALTGAGLAVAGDEDGVHLRVRLRTDAGTLVDPEVPIAVGRPAPDLVGEAPAVVGLRDPAQTIRVALELARITAPARVAAYDRARETIARFAQVDLDGDVVGALRQDATLTFPAGGGVTLRAPLDDEQALRDALGRLGRVGQVAGLAGAFGIGPDTGGLAFRGDGEDRYLVRQDGETVAVLAVRDGVFVASTDPAVDVDDVAGAAPTDRDGADTPVGALGAVLAPDALAGLLVDRLGLPADVRAALADVGTTVVTARAELGFVAVRADVAVGP